MNFALEIQDPTKTPKINTTQKSNTPAVNFEKFFLTANKKGNIHKWPLNTMNFMSETDPIDLGNFHTGEIKSMTYTKDLKFLFTTGVDRKLFQWDLNNFSLVHYWGDNLHRGPIYCILATRDSKWLFTGGKDQCLKKWSIAEKFISKDFGEIHDEWILCITESRNGKFLITGSADFSIRQYSLLDDTLMNVWTQLHDYPINKVVLSPKDDIAFTCSDEGTCKMIGLNNDNKRLNETFYNLHDDCIKTISVVTGNKDVMGAMGLH